MSAADQSGWFHLDGTECVAGWFEEGPQQGQCSRGGGPVTPCPTVSGLYAAAHALVLSVDGTIGKRPSELAERWSRDDEGVPIYVSAKQMADLARNITDSGPLARRNQ